MPEEERVKIGVPGIDELIGGGLRPKTLTLLTGTTGCGKTTFSSQFIFNGLKDFKENAVYVSFEEPVENIRENCLKFGWNFEPYEKEGKMIFVRYDPFHVEDIYELIETNIKRVNAKRVVIDSVSALGLYVKEPAEIRRLVFNIAFLLRRLDCTSILISEILPMQEALSRFGVEEFVTDAVIVLYYTRTGSQFSRYLTVWKMRGSSHSNKLHPYKISDKGLVVFPKEEATLK